MANGPSAESAASSTAMPRVVVSRVGVVKSILGETAILHRFGDVGWGDGDAAGQVGDAARDAQHAVVGARREVETGQRLFEQRGAGGVGLAVLVDLTVRQLSVGSALARQLPRTRRADAGGDERRRFAVGRILQVCCGQRGDFDLQIDAIEQRAGNPQAVTRDLIGRASALAAGRAVETAGAGIHRRDQLELCRKFGLARRARNVDATVFERLAQRFEHAAVEFGEFVEEQNALMRERNFARTRYAAACKFHS